MDNAKGSKMISNQKHLVNYLQASIDAMLLVIDLEQYETHMAHPNSTYTKILNDMRFMLDAETALLRRQAIGPGPVVDKNGQLLVYNNS